jgi:hypothetical protein
VYSLTQGDTIENMTYDQNSLETTGSNREAEMTTQTTERTFQVTLTETELQRTISALLGAEHRHISLARFAELEGDMLDMKAHKDSAAGALALIDRFERTGQLLYTSSVTVWTTVDAIYVCVATPKIGEIVEFRPTTPAGLRGFTGALNLKFGKQESPREKGSS